MGAYFLDIHAEKEVRLLGRWGVYDGYLNRVWQRVRDPIRQTVGPALPIYRKEGFM